MLFYMVAGVLWVFIIAALHVLYDENIDLFSLIIGGSILGLISAAIYFGGN